MVPAGPATAEQGYSSRLTFEHEYGMTGHWPGGPFLWPHVGGLVARRATSATDDPLRPSWLWRTAIHQDSRRLRPDDANLAVAIDHQAIKPAIHMND